MEVSGGADQLGRLEVIDTDANEDITVFPPPIHTAYGRIQRRIRCVPFSHYFGHLASVVT